MTNLEAFEQMAGRLHFEGKAVVWVPSRQTDPVMMMAGRETYDWVYLTEDAGRTAPAIAKWVHARFPGCDLAIGYGSDGSTERISAAQVAEHAASDA